VSKDFVDIIYYSSSEESLTDFAEYHDLTSSLLGGDDDDGVSSSRSVSAIGRDSAFLNSLPESASDVFTSAALEARATTDIYSQL
jgi:hypothetical protein